MNFLEKIKTIIFHPKDVEYLIYNRYISSRFPKFYSSYLFKREMNRKMNWNNPEDLDQKITWMQFFTDTKEWSRLADKYLVREYVKSKGCDHILIPLLGKWDSVNEIDFQSLPSKFVIRTNCSCGDTYVVKDKSNADFYDIKSKLQYKLDHPMGYDSAELHYLRIKPCIVAEKLLEPLNGDLIDYKFYCFHSKPYCVLVCSNRNIKDHTVDFSVYSLEWQRRNNCLIPEYDNVPYISKPQCLEEMIRYAKILSEPFPFVRIDFYEVLGKVYFGEMTFTPKKGRDNTWTYEFSKELGSQLDLSVFGTYNNS